MACYVNFNLGTARFPTLTHQSTKKQAPRGAPVFLVGEKPNQSNQWTMPTANISISTPGEPKPVPEMP